MRIKWLQNERAGLRRRRWPESPSVGRSYESRTGTRGTPAGDAEREALWALGSHGKLGGTAPRTPQGYVLATALYSSKSRGPPPARLFLVTAL